METKTRIFERQKLRTRKVAGIPVSLLAAILCMGIAAAAIVALGPFSAPQTSTPQAIYVAANSAVAEPGYGGVESVLPYGSTDHVWVQAWQAGYSTTTVIHLVIRTGSTSFATCADAAAAIMAGDGSVGKISLDNHPFASPVLVDINTGTFAAGKCTIDTSPTVPS